MYHAFRFAVSGINAEARETILHAVMIIKNRIVKEIVVEFLLHVTLELFYFFFEWSFTYTRK